MTIEDDELALRAASIAIQEGLELFESNISEMTAAMDAFELSVLRVEEIMKPIDEMTHKLVLGQNNISKSIIEFEAIHINFDIVKRSIRIMEDETANQETINNAIRDASRARAFLIARPDFNSAQATLDTLDPVLKRSLDSMFDKIEVRLQNEEADEDMHQVDDTEIKRLFEFIIDECKLEKEAAEFYADIRSTPIENEIDAMASSLFGDLQKAGVAPSKLVRRFSAFSGNKASAEAAAATTSKPSERRFRLGRTLKKALIKTTGGVVTEAPASPAVSQISHILSERKYEKGQHGLHVIMKRVVELWQAEYEIAKTVLPSGPSGMRVFNAAMSNSTRKLRDLVLDRVIPYTKHTFPGTAMLFVFADVNACFTEYVPVLRTMFGGPSNPPPIPPPTAEESFTRTRLKKTLSRYRSLTNLDVPLETHATWRHIEEIYDRWDEETKESMRDLFNSVLFSKIDNIYESGTIHHSTTTIIKIVKRSLIHKDQICKLCVSVWKYDESMDSSEILAKFVEVVLSRYVRLLIALDASEEFMGKLGIFILNNLHYLIGGFQTQSQIQQLLANSEVWANDKRKLQIVKTVCIKSVVRTFEELVSAGPSGYSLVPPPRSVNLSLKRAIKEYANGITEWLRETSEMYSSFEVPDAKLRSELREKFTANMIPIYSHLYDMMSHEVYHKVRSKYLPLSVGDVSAMIGDFFLVSEAASPVNQETR